MARGFGLRARLIGGGGGGQVGFGSGVAQGLNSIAAQIAAQNDPDVQMARQLQGLKIQAARAQLEAQQQERETMAGYGRLGEQMFPEAGTEVPTEAEGPGAGQVLGTFAGEPTANDRLMKALVQTGNPRAMEYVQAQMAPQPEASVVDLGGGQRGIKQPGGKITPLPTIQKKEPSYGAPLTERVAEMFGKPVSEATPEELRAARQNITEEKNADDLKKYQQMRDISVATARIGKDEEPMPPTYSYYDRTTGDKMTVPTKGDYKRNRDKIAVLSSKDADNYDLLATAQPNLDMMRNVLPKILQSSGGGQNLSNAVSLWLKRVGGSNTQLAQFDMTRNFLITMMARVETGGVRPPVVLIKMVKDQLPLDRNNVNAALQEIAIMEREIKNRQGTMIGNRPQPLPDLTPTQKPPPPPAGFK